VIEQYSVLATRVRQEIQSLERVIARAKHAIALAESIPPIRALSRRSGLELA